MKSVERPVAIGIALLLATSAGACLESDESDMTIDVFWDRRADADVFSGTTCAVAGVDRMEWRLTNTDEDKQVAEGVDSCCRPGEYCSVNIDALVIRNPSPGAYALAITGFDEMDQARWGATCDGLRITRFDVAYPCDVPEPGQ